MPDLPGPGDCRGGCVYQPKFDGWRALLFRRADGTVYLQSRQLRDLTPYFPDIAAAAAATLPPETVLDGELIVWDPAAGRTLFPALQARVSAGRRLPTLAAAQPATFVAFDVLELCGTLTTGAPLSERRTMLEEILGDGPAALPVCPQTGDLDQARQWFDELACTGCEGIVAKDDAGRYRAGRPGWWKIKRRTTTEAIVAGVLGTVEAPAVLLLGRYTPDGRLRYVGRTVPLAAVQRAELAGALTAATGVHPWPWPLPAAWSGQLDRREQQDYLPVDPRVIAEIVVDEAHEHGRWRHLVRLERLRGDLRPQDVPPPP
ncbi:ATP-dependent DNA ligase [Actinoplanes subglobosus]|uniref:ATP-dependent DNA ligase n=1 Tax=Actinoplanes subglobosus TaxID=1547892 RepID=A0ABV8ISS5_9ACTN